MNGKWAIPVLASILILGIFGSSQLTVEGQINNPPESVFFLISVVADTISTSPTAIIDDEDSDGDAIFISEIDGVAEDVGQLITRPLGYLLRVDSDGTYLVNPNGQFDILLEGEMVMDEIPFTISDGSLTAIGAIFVEIIGVNDPPSAPDDTTYALDKNSVNNPLDVLTGAFDVDGDAFTITSASADRGGTVSIVSGTSLEYTPALDFLGIETVTYIITETRINPLSDTGTATIIVGTNDPDGDGITDFTDNCTTIFNPDQADSNNNGVGDVCDPETLLIAQLQDEITGLLQQIVDKDALIASLQSDLAAAQADLANLYTNNSCFPIATSIQEVLDCILDLNTEITAANARIAELELLLEKYAPLTKQECDDIQATIDQKIADGKKVPNKLQSNLAICTELYS